MTLPHEHMIPYHSTSRKRRSLGFGAIEYMAAAVDFAIVLISSTLGFMLYEHVVFGAYNDPSPYVGIGLVASTMFVLAMSGVHAYSAQQILQLRRQVMLVVLLITTVLCFLLTVIFFLKLGDTISRGAIITIAFISTVGLLGTRYLWYAHAARSIAHGMFRRRRVLLICPKSYQVDQLRGHAGLSGMEITHVLPVCEEDSIGGLTGDVLRRNGIGNVDEVLVVWKRATVADMESNLSALRRFPLAVNVIFDSFVGGIVSGESQKIGGVHAFQTQRPPLAAWERGLKRCFDVVFSFSALILLLPVLILIAIAIKMESKGPVLFVQSRKGYGGDAFRILKFRSMRVMEDGAGIRQATRNDPRITRIGTFLRAASLDELPQFWNVLRGEMSIVGPRPHAIAHDDLYDALISEYAMRQHVKPGVTGWAQVSGCRGETPTVEKMRERVLHDLWYINNWSIWLDLWVILKTVIVVPDLTKAY